MPTIVIVNPIELLILIVWVQDPTHLGSLVTIGVSRGPIGVRGTLAVVIVPIGVPRGLNCTNKGTQGALIVPIGVPRGLSCTNSRGYPGQLFPRTTLHMCSA